MSEHGSADYIITLTSDIVSAFVSNNTVRMSELPELIAAVHTSLVSAGAPTVAEEPPAELKPAVPIKKSITDDYLICLDDGKKFKSLKRHLQQAFGMSPDDYRQKWNLGRDYPMVAPGYAAKRSELARASGLGSDRRKIAAPPMPAAQDEVIEAPAREIGADAPAKTRGRPRLKKAA